MNIKARIDTPLVGTADDVIRDVSIETGIDLDRDKVEFLKSISKTKYSGLTKNNLISSLNILTDKDEDWFQELVDDGLAEICIFNSPQGNNRKWEGWFITSKGRKILKEIMNRI